jgi:hypothetical protein
LDLRLRQHFIDHAIEHAHDLSRHTGWREHSLPRCHHQIGALRVGEGNAGGQRCGASEANKGPAIRWLSPWLSGVFHLRAMTMAQGKRQAR